MIKFEFIMDDVDAMNLFTAMRDHISNIYMEMVRVESRGYEYDEPTKKAILASLERQVEYSEDLISRMTNYRVDDTGTPVVSPPPEVVTSPRPHTYSDRRDTIREYTQWAENNQKYWIEGGFNDAAAVYRGLIYLLQDYRRLLTCLVREEEVTPRDPDSESPIGWMNEGFSVDTPMQFSPRPGRVAPFQGVPSIEEVSDSEKCWVWGDGVNGWFRRSGKHVRDQGDDYFLNWLPDSTIPLPTK